MKIKLIRKGHFYDIYAVTTDGECPFEDYLKKLENENPASFKALLTILARHADHGQIWDDQKSKPVKGTPGLLEFKTTQGARVPYFYLKGKRTILTHGFDKGAPTAPEYKKASDAMKEFEEG